MSIGGRAEGLERALKKMTEDYKKLGVKYANLLKRHEELKSSKDPSAARPYTPKDANRAQSASLPKAVLDAVNEFLAERAEGSVIVIHQSELIASIRKKMPEIDKEEIFDRRWLDFEGVYSKAGWNVSYDRPGYNETYDPSWEFTRKRT